MVTTVSHGASLLSSTDLVFAIDTDAAPGTSGGGSAGSSIPGVNEAADKAFDGSTATKYLNFGQRGSGAIVSGTAPSIVQSIGFSTANDSAERDPMSFNIFGTNSALSSAQHSTGTAEQWTLIGYGTLAPPTTRFAAVPTVNLVNSTSYASYKIVFPTVRSSPTTANSMQISEISLYAGLDGTSPIPLNSASAIATDSNSASHYPANERPSTLVDGNAATKYLNFGEENSGFIVRPSVGATVATGFIITTANDAEERDPASYQLYGTTSAIASSDNSRGNEGENWVLISSGALSLPTGVGSRLVDAPEVTFANSDAYTAYKVLFPTVRNAATANSMQIAGFQLTGTVVPEPGAVALVGLAAGTGLLRRRRK